MKKIISLLLVFSLTLCFASCGTANNNDGDLSSGNTANSSVADTSVPQFSEEYKYARVTMKDFGEFVIELNCKDAPITANNFISLVEKKFYDGLTIHRLYQGLIIQGGDPNGNGTGGPGYTIKGEFAANGYANPISHTRGTISMARRGDSFDSAGSQFFIMLQDYPGWDGQYASFGHVISGMDVVDAIGASEYNASTGMPFNKIVIEKIEMIEYKQ